MSKPLILALSLLISASCFGQAKDTSRKNKIDTANRPIFELTDTTKVFFDLTHEHFRYMMEALDNSNYGHQKIKEIFAAYNSSLQKFLLSKYTPLKEKPKQ